MAEEKKTRVVIASVLKPFDDVRMFEKIARTIASKDIEVHCIGYGIVRSDRRENIYVHGLGIFRRLSLRRWMASWLVFKKTVALKPTHFILTTHELLFIAWLMRMLTNARIIYDVQENYYLNILHTNAFPPLLRNIVAKYVRLKEAIFKSTIAHFLLAEKVYVEQLSFVQSRHTVIENKARKPTHVNTAINDDHVVLLFSGTLAESTGVFTAIKLCEELHKVDHRIRLRLVGYAPMQSTLDRIREAIADKPYISLTGGAQIVSHGKIIEAICEANFGIISYPSNPSTEGRIPTKLYEYVAFRLPLLISNRHCEWLNICEPYNAALAFDADNINADILLHTMQGANFYTTQAQVPYWEDQEPSLLQAVFPK